MAMIKAVGISVAVNSWRRFHPSDGESSTGWLVVPKTGWLVVPKTTWLVVPFQKKVNYIY